MPKTVGQTLRYGYDLYNSDFTKMMMSHPNGGGYYNRPFAPVDNTRVIVPYIIIKKVQ